MFTSLKRRLDGSKSQWPSVRKGAHLTLKGAGNKERPYRGGDVHHGLGEVRSAKEKPICICRSRYW